MDEDSKTPAASDGKGGLNIQLSLDYLLSDSLRTVLGRISQGSRDAAIIIVAELRADADQAGKSCCAEDTQRMAVDPVFKTRIASAIDAGEVFNTDG